MNRHPPPVYDASVSVAPVEVGEGGIALLVGNGLLKENETRDRDLVAGACLKALEEWSRGHGCDDPHQDGGRGCT